MEEKNTIKELFMTGDYFDEPGMVSALKSLVTIRPETYDIYFLEDDIKNDDRVLVYALAKKLLYFKKFIKESFISAVEVHNKTGLPKGSVDTSFNRLKGEFLLGGGKKYELPDRKIPLAIKRLASLKRSTTK
jgi:hypothetical protein